MQITTTYIVFYIGKLCKLYTCHIIDAVQYFVECPDGEIVHLSTDEVDNLKQIKPLP